MYIKKIYNFLDLNIFLEKLIDSKNYGIYNVDSKKLSYSQRIKILSTE